VTTVGPALEAFLAQPLLAVVGTLRRNGAILLTPVWFEHRAGEVWLNSYASATWPRHLRRTGTATLLLVDPADPLRTAHLECALAEITSAGARARRLTSGSEVSPPRRGAPDPASTR
jgi:hypothetical protein